MIQNGKPCYLSLFNWQTMIQPWETLLSLSVQLAMYNGNSVIIYSKPELARRSIQVLKHRYGHEHFISDLVKGGQLT